MGADVVPPQSACCSNPVMAVENVVLAAPSPDVDGRERLTLAHGDQHAAQSCAGSITDWPEPAVEQMGSAVDRPHDAGERDELLAGVPKLRVFVDDILQNWKCRAATVAQEARRSGPGLLTTQSFEVEGAVHAWVSGAGRSVRTSNDSLEEEEASDHGQDSQQVEEELAQHRITRSWRF